MSYYIVSRTEGCTTVICVFFFLIRSLPALSCGASLVRHSQYYCCCLHYPPFPSLPLTVQAAASDPGYFYFCKFLLLQRGSNSNWTSVSGHARDSQVRVRATDGERKSGRLRNTRSIKEAGFPSMTVLSPHCASARALSHHFLACLWVVLFPVTWSMAHSSARLPVLGSSSSHIRRRAVFLCFLVGRRRVSWSSPRGWGGTFFPQICTWLSVCFAPTRAIKTSNPSPFIVIQFPFTLTCPF